MKTQGIALSLLLGAAFASTAAAQCPIKDSIMGVGSNFETYTPEASVQNAQRPDGMTGATVQHRDCAHGKNQCEGKIPTMMSTTASVVSVWAVMAKWFRPSKITA